VIKSTAWTLTKMVKQLQLSKLFWIALGINYLFGIAVLYSILTIPNNIFDINNNPEHLLAAFKLTYVRAAIVTFALISYPILLLKSRKYITLFTVGLTAWVAAMYIDDNLVLYRIIEYPDRTFVVLLQTFRPIAIACLIWMSFELTFSKYKKY
jgi:hypothetical protein